ncbi:hypothetical protein [Acinetobacter rathckeae]|nr:hypothetical protein [Acinetobacter rathckeae]
MQAFCFIDFQEVIKENARCVHSQRHLSMAHVPAWVIDLSPQGEN